METISPVVNTHMDQKILLKTCPRCSQEKPYSAFGTSKRDGIQSYCKSCKKEWSHSPSGRLCNKLAVSKYQKSTKGKDTLRRQGQSDCGKARYLRYRQSAKGKQTRLINKRRRRDRKNNLDTQYSVMDEQFTRALFDDRCFACESRDHVQIDHHYPLSAGFGLTRDNAVLLCRSCNASKGSSMPHEFYSPKQLQALECLLPLV